MSFPNALTSMFKTSNNKNYKLRSNALDFALPKPTTNYLKKSFSYSGAAFWNDLLVSISNLFSFFYTPCV